MAIQHLAFISVHTSPLAPMGGKKTGGMNVYIRELALELANRGIEIDIFTRRTSPCEQDIDASIHPNVRVVYLTAGPIDSLSPDDVSSYLTEFTARLIAFATIQSINYDIIYSHYWLSGVVAQKLKESWGTPFVQMFHTLGQMKQRIGSADTGLPDQRIRNEVQIVEWADKIVAATPAEQAQLLWLYHAKRRKIAIIPPGVNIERFQPLSRDDAKRQLDLDRACHLLLFVGRIEPLKGVDTIIHALAMMREEDPDLSSQICFAVVGGDPQDTTDTEMMRLIDLVHELELTDIVSFQGAKDQSTLPLYYTAASAVLMPSDYESFGMVALEAMASGTPVIASHVGGLAFLIQHKETGYLIPTREPISLAQSIRMIINDSEERKKMGQNASHLAQDYAWSKIADQLLTVFEDIIINNTKRSNRHKR